MKTKKTHNWVGNLFMWPFKLFPIKKNRIYFCARYGEQFNCNPRAFFEFLYQNHHDEFEFVWCLNEPSDDLPSDVKRAKFLSLKDLYYMHTSKFLITNNRFCMLFAKRKKQVYIHAAHGSVCTLKNVEFDQNLGFFTRWNAKIDSSQEDALLTPSDQMQEIYPQAFQIDESKVFKTGYPRTDQLIIRDERKMKIVREKLGLKMDDFVILYGPTFRDNQPYIVLNNELIKKSFEKSTGKNVKILYHFHPRWKKENIKHVQFSEDVINATIYPEFQDLVLIADVLISDVSSCMFDMALQGKLCIQDRRFEEEYLKNERNSYMSFDKLPFPSVKKEEDYAKIAENYAQILPDYQKKAKIFLDEIGSVEDGHSCQRVFDLMMKIANEKEKHTN